MMFFIALRIAAVVTMGVSAVHHFGWLDGMGLFSLAWIYIPTIRA